MLYLCLYRLNIQSFCPRWRKWSVETSSTKHFTRCTSRELKHGWPRDVRNRDPSPVVYIFRRVIRYASPLISSFRQFSRSFINFYKTWYVILSRRFSTSRGIGNFIEWRSIPRLVTDTRDTLSLPRRSLLLRYSVVPFNTNSCPMLIKCA